MDSLPYRLFANTITGVWCCLTRLFRRQQSVALPSSNRVVNFKRAICALNLLILVALTITVSLVVDQMHPSCPTVLLFLPLLGTVSMLATVALLIVLARSRREHNGTVARRIRFSLGVLCLVLFVPYMFYWNLIGLRF
jgi:peptidoglycan/LPS O-acetylase OafA/YrhL